ncbi:MAG: recombinase family protein [Campylobacterota bacterium]|nr:recombinase family protein [Campylobacterota bacterium]
MTISYIRPDKHFDGAYDQLKLINAYAEPKGLVIESEMLDHTSQSKRISERSEVTDYFQSHENSTLIVYDSWVLSSNIEDLVQMISCLFKRNITLHLVKPSVVLDKSSDVMVVLGLIDQLRQILQNESKKAIGRPKGSRSNSKFDKYLEDIIGFLRVGKSVSEMARNLGVSRSSLKDYIESRELREVALGSIHMENSEMSEAHLIETIKCPTEV